MTQVQTAQTAEEFVFNEIKELTGSFNKFRNVARIQVAINFARKGYEAYGNGMAKFNRAIKALIDQGKIIRIVKGRNTYYCLPQTVSA